MDERKQTHPLTPSTGLRCSQAVGGVPAAVLTDELRRLATADAVNLALGVPDHPGSAAAITAAVHAMEAGRNQYVDSRGSPALREAIAAALTRETARETDAAREITVTTGATGGLYCALAALLDPGDEAVLLDPFYPQHANLLHFLRARVRHAAVPDPDWRLDADALAGVVRPGTRAVVLCNPDNPTGRVWTASELGQLAEACRRHDAVLVVDEVYAELAFGAFVSAWAAEARENVVVVRSASKSFQLSGWRVGYVAAPAWLTPHLRTVHELAAIGVATPLQEGVHAALEAGEADDRRSIFRDRRDRLARLLGALGARPTRCEGGMFQVFDVRGSPWPDDLAFCRRLAEAGVLVMPGRPFFVDPARGRHFVRVTFGRGAEVIQAAEARLRDLVPATT